MAVRLRPGDLVEVKPPEQILETLDAEGTVDCLPFMPEMLPFCGRRFRVSRRVVKSCTSGAGPSTMRTFRNDDLVLLEDLRCSGADHDGCQKGCMIFWREAWLRPVKGSRGSNDGKASSEQLRGRLKTSTGATTYFCQASELLKATRQLSRWERVSKCFEDIAAGNSTTLEMGRRIGVWLSWRLRRALFGELARGRGSSTPVESLTLQPGERVEVKAMSRIVETLDKAGRNRGLYFFPDMRVHCGRQLQVARRVDQIIVDGTGEMRQLRNTVFLEGSLCDCDHVAFGGCPRREFAYWREIWLRRPGSSN